MLQANSRFARIFTSRSNVNLIQRAAVVQNPVRFQGGLAQEVEPKRNVETIGEYWSERLINDGLTSNGAVMSDLYDGWAKDYDKVTDSWGYKGPQMVAARLSSFFSTTQEKNVSEARVLDCGCGTGLGGEALFNVGFREIVGCDVSAGSLELIQATRSQVYKETMVVDMKQFPFPIADDSYDGLVCVGVFTHFETDEIPPIFDEWTRIMKPGSVGVFSHRSARMVDDTRCVDEMAASGKWEILSHDKNEAYLAENQNPTYSAHHLADYVVFRVL